MNLLTPEACGSPIDCRYPTCRASGHRTKQAIPPPLSPHTVLPRQKSLDRHPPAPSAYMRSFIPLVGSPKPPCQARSQTIRDMSQNGKEEETEKVPNMAFAHISSLDPFRERCVPIMTITACPRSNMYALSLCIHGECPIRLYAGVVRLRCNVPHEATLELGRHFP